MWKVVATFTESVKGGEHVSYGKSNSYFSIVTAQLNPTLFKLEWQCKWSVIHPTPSQTFRPFPGYPGSWFSACNLILNQLDDSCKKKIRAEFFFTQFFLTHIFFTQKNFRPKFCWPKKSFRSTFFLAQKCFLPNFFLPAIFFDPKIFDPKFFFTQIFFY